MGNLVDYARSELEKAGLFDNDSDYGGMLAEAVMELVEVFSKQEHSGFSASMALEIFSRVASFEPLVPLTGDPDEWVNVSEDPDRPWFQNKRASNVFADDEHGKNAYDISGIVFVDKNGSTFTTNESTVFVEFPYSPVSRYITEGSPEAEEFKHVFAKYYE